MQNNHRKWLKVVLMTSCEVQSFDHARNRLGLTIAFYVSESTTEQFIIQLSKLRCNRCENSKKLTRLITFCFIFFKRVGPNFSHKIFNAFDLSALFS